MFTVDEVIKATGGRLIAGDKNFSARGVSSDSRSIKQGDLFVAIRGRNFDGHNFIDQTIKKGAQIIIVDRDFRFDVAQCRPRANAGKLLVKDCAKASFVRVDNTKRALADIAKFHRSRLKNIPLVGVTGSCGKTTTKDMIYEILSAEFNVLKNKGTLNNLIGVSHTLLRLNKQVDIAVIEMGTSNLGEIHRLTEMACPNVGVITNIGPSHLEFFGSMESVNNEKFQLIRNLCSPNIAILNGDDRLLKEKIGAQEGKSIFTFGINNRCDIMASNIKVAKEIINFTLNNKHQFRLNILGRHNIYNALAAVSCGVIFGIEIDEIKRRLFDFVLSRTRISLRKIRNYQIIDDTYNSNPLSLTCALDTLANLNTKGKKIFVMGDMLELGKKSIPLHRKAGEKIIKSGIDTLITVGHLSDYAADFVKSRCSDIKVYSCRCSLEAKGILLNLIRSHDLVLVKGSRAMQMEKILQDI